jgi:ABC-type bacteriocin/lantibiotic exporter with double-glycine peptidase domain
MIISSVLLDLPLPLLTMYFIDTIIPQQDVFRLHLIGLLLLGVLIVGTVIDYFRNYYSSLLSQKITQKTGMDALVNLIRSDYQQIQNDTTGYWFMRVVQDAQEIGVAFENIISIITQVFTFLLGLTLTFYFSWQLGVAVSILIPFYLLSFKYLNPRIRERDTNLKEINAKLSGLIEETIANIIEIKSLFLEKLKANQVRNKWDTTINVSMKYVVLTTLLSLAGNFVGSIGSITILWYGGYLVITKAITLGKLIALNRFLGYVISPIQGFMGINQQLQSIFVSYNRIRRISEMSRQKSNTALIYEHNKSKGNMIEIKDLSFAYDASGKKRVFDHLSLEIPLSGFTCLSAPSGFGKSTLFKLIAGILMAESGQIRICTERKIKNNDIILVPQNASLFSCDVLENILMGRDIAFDKVAESVHQLELDDFIKKLPDGYHTELGSLDGRVSGGEKQRVALVRAIVLDPYILLIDEMTSDIDVKTESKIFQSLKKGRKNKITIFITHRESTMDFADNIIDFSLRANMSEMRN